MAWETPVSTLSSGRLIASVTHLILAKYLPLSLFYSTKAKGKAMHGKSLGREPCMQTSGKAAGLSCMSVMCLGGGLQGRATWVGLYLRFLAVNEGSRRLLGTRTHMHIDLHVGSIHGGQRRHQTLLLPLSHLPKPHCIIYQTGQRSTCRVPEILA